MSTDTFANWTPGEARLSSYEDVTSDDSSKATEYTEIYTVLMPDIETIANPSNVSGLPANGDKSSIDGLTHLRVVNRTFVKADPNSRVWEIRVSYGVPGSGRRVLIAEQDGSDYISVSWSVDEVTSDLCYDINNRAVINSAGDPFDSVPQKTEFVPHITIVRRESSLPDLSYNGSINDEDVTILGVDFAKHCARLKIQVNQVANDKPYEVTYEIIGMRNYAPAEGYETSSFEDWGWDVPMLECGYQFYDENGILKKFTVTGDDGVPRECSTPQLLDFEGKDARGRNPHIRRFEPYPKRYWATFRFPEDESSVVITE